MLKQYVYADNVEALEVATGMGKWAATKLKDIDEPTRLKMLRNEFGGINEAFYNLYSLTTDPDFLSVAEFFYHPDVIDPLKAGNADLGTKHTNTFIPKVLGEMRRYELTGDEESLNLSRFFWEEMLAHHTFAPGCSSDKEHYFKPEEFSKHISGYTGETDDLQDPEICPIVMAARLGTDGMESPAPYSNPILYNDYYTYDYHIPEGLPTEIDLQSLKKTGPLTFITTDGLTIEPLYDIHRERYGVYWKQKSDKN